tara:strand:+ start:302 stop:568 length:267 start_codon:yes stop_codon:yes gene_type:complete
MKYPMTNNCKQEMLSKIINKTLTQDDYELMEVEIMDYYGEKGYTCYLDHDREVIDIINDNGSSVENVAYIELNNKEEVIQEYLKGIIK